MAFDEVIIPPPIIDPDIPIIPGEDQEAIASIEYNPNQCVTFNLIKEFYLPDTMINTSGSGDWLNYQDHVPSENQLLLGSWIDDNLYTIGGSGKLVASSIVVDKVAIMSELVMKRCYCDIQFYFANNVTSKVIISSPSLTVTLKDGTIVHDLPKYLELSSGSYRLDLGGVINAIVSKGGTYRAWSSISSIKCNTTLLRSPTLNNGQLVSTGDYESATRLPVGNSDQVLRGNSDNPFTLNSLYLV